MEEYNKYRLYEGLGIAIPLEWGQAQQPEFSNLAMSDYGDKLTLTCLTLS